MSVVDRKLRLLENVARLRRAQRRLSADTDLAAVRSSLEHELGETVSQRLAGRFLGISHTALARWLDAGDLTLVEKPNGRREVPVQALLDLKEKVDRERERGRRTSHLLEPTMTEGRIRAHDMQIQDLLGSPIEGAGHSVVERRSMAYHRALASRLTRKMAREAQHRVWRWREEGKLAPRYADAWEQLLGKPLETIREEITNESPKASDLRQNSPFAGMLSEPERRRIVESIR